jgi:hypothetical protein
MFPETLTNNMLVGCWLLSAATAAAAAAAATAHLFHAAWVC